MVFQRVCVCFCMSEVISSFKSLRAVVSLCDIAYYVVG